MANEFINLDRTFHELRRHKGEADDFDIQAAFGYGKSVTWDALVNEYRVILLSEAGAGKTVEIRQAAKRQRAAGKSAFFLRLEHVADDFDIAFEEGSLAEFDQWLGSNGEGWLFLDSVDESRLKEPADFNRAVRKLGLRLAPALQRAHIFISSRGSAWRPVTDLSLCRDQLKYQPPKEQAADEASDGKPASRKRLAVIRTADEEVEDPFKLVALDDLREPQVRKFAQAKGVTDVDSFVDSVERADAWIMAHRPRDLEELTGFWVKNGRVGNRLELMRESLDQRLSEPDQRRDEARPLSKEKARAGARLLAAAATMTHETIIRVPDGTQNAVGLPVADVLKDWGAPDQTTLLLRPIFDEAIYGTVRFHHRTQREYLAAEWFDGLLKRETSRREVEMLFFREQYDIEVITPSLRPVLVWLILLDERMRERALRIAPELIFEGGEPAELPLATRREVLRKVCATVSKGGAGHRMDYAAVQRFANADLVHEIKALIRKFGTRDDLLWILLRMVWQGRLAEALPEAKQYALKPDAGKYVRIAAIRTVLGVGTAQDAEEVRAAFVAEARRLKRDWLAELVKNLPYDQASVDWLLSALAKTEPKPEFSTDGLGEAISEFVCAAPIDLLANLVTGIVALISKRPIIERHNYEISQRHGWLLKRAAQAVERLIEARHLAALGQDCLSVLQKLPSASDYHDWDLRDIRSRIPELVPAWVELNDTLFWYHVKLTRRRQSKNRDARLTDFWPAYWKSYCRFPPDAFDRIKAQIRAKRGDDRLVALSLAFQLYRDAGKPARWRNQLKAVCKRSPALTIKLRELLHPPPPSAEAKSWQRQEAQWKRRDKERRQRIEENKAEWRTHLAANVQKLRDPGLPKPQDISNDQFYMHEKLRKLGDRSNHWTHGDWHLLEIEFDESIARAFRDGVVSYWRRYQPALLSDPKGKDSTTFATIFGLTGIEIEATETPAWPSTLTVADAETAFRYGMNELNGFPEWFPGLYAAFPQRITELLLVEIDYELRTGTAERESHYVIYDLSWHGEWSDDTIAPAILERLARKELKSIGTLGYLLTIVNRAGVSDSALAALAEKKVRQKVLDHAAAWYAVWAGVEPGRAIESIRLRFDKLKSKPQRVQFAMQFASQLVGDRHDKSVVRQAYRTPSHLRDLIILMHQHIEEKDDIERAGKGAYSPGLRDNAQDARNHLFGLLKEIPGKEAFLAIQDLSRRHPVESTRPWMAHHAKSKAETEADLSPWTVAQVNDFNERLERTPRNHRELWELGVLRMLDLKAKLEDGDSSVADILKTVSEEIQMRKYIGDWLRDSSHGRYSIPQEEEFADAKRSDLRFHGAGFDAPVPLELKLADNWTGPKLFERLETQLCGDYLRDDRSNRGMFVLVYRGQKSTWEVPGRDSVDFNGLVDALHHHWLTISDNLAGVDDVKVIGIDLTRRSR
ncbi:hypothetical protein MTR62_15500 [Novosphingobium sp. 1949]|uniref:ATP-binding protein n=1 Tax=Novosphingobium organovorum TaxID=2930092 RepID=A0ABT0BGD5_9SPHN|nr:hypothetical protein [Novosphingobium organovorum]MCJ2184089.1 hypothetical protein [Novosphingobium organovorum]